MGNRAGFGAARLEAEGDGEVGLPDAGWTEQQDVSGISDERHRGKLADLAVLSDDPRDTAVDALAQIKSLLTMVGGRIVHRETWS